MNGNKKALVILAILAALVAGYYFGTQRAPAGDPVRSLPSTAPVSRSFVTSAPNTQSYILNKKTKKFHKPTCYSVKQMNESNKIYVTKSREEIISDGYSPCGNCNP